LDYIGWDCKIFTQQVEATWVVRSPVLEGHEQQIQIIEFILKSAGTGIIAIQNHLQNIIAEHYASWINCQNRWHGVNGNNSPCWSHTPYC
jgi:hypothetical protein